MMAGRIGMAIAVVALAAACERAPAPVANSDTARADTTSRTTPTIVLVDTAVPPAAVGDERWEFQRLASADIDGDGAAERIALIANIELVRGRPAWDDGQRWQLYVEEADGTRTRLYARFVQLGHVEAFLGPAAADGRHPILIVERTPHRLAIYEATYRAPGDVVVRELAAPEIDPATSLEGTPLN